jgi:hypothetical protein
MKRAPPKLGQHKKTSPTKKKSPAKPKPKAETQPDAIDDAPLPAKGAYSIGNLSICHKPLSYLNP